MIISVKSGEKRKIDIDTENKTFCTNYYQCKIHPDFHIPAGEYKTIIDILERLDFKES